MNLIKLEILRKTIKSFDIILCTTNSQFSSLINYSQQLVNGRGKYTHIALCIRGSDLPKGCVFDDKLTGKSYKVDLNEVYLFESVVDTVLESKNVFGEYFDGVQLRKFDETFEKYFELQKQGIFTELAHSSVNMKYNPRSEYTYNIIKKYLGTKYNVGIIDKIYVPFRYIPLIYLIKHTKDLFYGSSIENNGILCTTLAGQVLKDIGLIDPDIDPNTMLTEDFVYKTWSAKNNKFPQIYLEPVDIIE
jgi:hypothetical protein